MIASLDVLEAASDACTMNLVINPDDEAQMGDAVVAAGSRTWTTEQRGALACRLTAMVKSSSRAAWQARQPNRVAPANDIAWHFRQIKSIYTRNISTTCQDQTYSV